MGLEISSEGVAIAQGPGASSSRAELNLCEFLSFDPATDDPKRDSQLQRDMLEQRIDALDLKNAPCHVVMPVGSYQLLLVEAPKVEPKELGEAIRWRIKDLINYPLEEAAVDAFLLPKDSSSSGASMAYAVVVKKEYIRSLVSFVEQARLELKAIDIGEMCLQNVLSAGADKEALSRSTALVKFRQGSGSLHVYKAGNLYLSRQFKLDYGAGLLDDLPQEALVLELQRSLDYYERQMRQVPPRTIYFCGDNISEDKITDGIQSSLSADIKVLPVSESFELSETIEAHILSLCLPAVGATLRPVGEI